MRNNRLKYLAVMGAALALTVETACGTPIFINEGFEEDAWSPGTTNNVSPSGWSTVQSSGVFVQGVHNTSNLTDLHTPFGEQFIILCARDCLLGGTLGSVSQTISGFQVNARYNLSFMQSPEFGGSSGSNGGILDTLVNVLISGAGAISQDFSADSVYVSGRRWADWKLQDLAFTADAETLTFKFAGIAPNGCGFGPGVRCEVESGIDNITLTQIPEPATLTLVGLGLAGFGFSRRIRAQPKPIAQPSPH